MNEQWWYRTFGEEFGPVTVDDILQLYRSGTLNENDSVRCGLRGKWQALGALPHLATEAQTPDGDEGFELSLPTSRRHPEPNIRQQEQRETWTSIDEFDLSVARSSDVDSRAQSGKQRQHSAPNEVAPQSADAIGQSASDTASPKPDVSTAASLHSENKDNGASPPSELSSAIYQATQDSLQKQRARSGQPTFERKTTTSRRFNLQTSFGRVFSPVASLLSVAFYPLSLLAEFCRDYWMVPVAIVITGTLVGAVVFIPKYWWTNEGLFAELDSIQTEYSTLKSDAPNGQRWSEFQIRAQKQADYIVSCVDSTANANRPVRLALLRLARDYLPAMLNEAGTSSGDAEMQFVAHMDQTNLIIKRSNGGNIQSSDWMMPAMLAIDGILIVVGGYWLLRRKS